MQSRCYFSAADNSESVICVARLGRKARARGAAAERDLMSPRAAARDTPRARRRARWIAIRRDAIVVGGVPVAAPFVDVLAHVEESVAVRCACSDSLRPVERAFVMRIIAPRVMIPFDSASRGTLPLRLGRQSKTAATAIAQPLAISRGVSPRNAGDWLARIIEMRIVAKRWRLELRVFGVCHLACADLECVDPNSMKRTLVVLAVFRTHHEPCTRDGDHARTTLFASPATVSHAAPGKRCVSSSTSCMAPRNQSQSCCVMVIGGRNLITSV